MENFDKLGKIIIKHNKDNTDPNYVCIGYGDDGDDNGLATMFDIPNREIYSKDDSNFESGFAGSDPNRLYYITYSLYWKFIKELRAHINTFTLQDAIDFAQTFIGKSVMGEANAFVVEGFSLFNKFSSPSWMNAEGEAFIEKNGWVVVVENNDDFSVVTKDLDVVNMVKLNDTYDAIIEGDYVKVGCQTIHKDRILELAKRLQ